MKRRSCSQIPRKTGGTRSIECLPRDAVSRVSPKHRRVVDRDMSVIEVLFTIGGSIWCPRCLHEGTDAHVCPTIYFILL